MTLLQFVKTLKVEVTAVDNTLVRISLSIKDGDHNKHS